MKFQSPYGNPYSQLDQNSAAPAGAVAGNQSYELDNVNPYGAAQPAAGGAGNNDMITFFAEVDDIKKNLTQYDDFVDRIESLHQRSMAEVNDDQLGLINSQISTLVDETMALAKEIRTRIQALLNRSQNNSTKMAQAENVKHQFSSSVQRYMGIQSAFRQKYRERAERQYRTVRPEASEDEVKQAIDEADAGNNQIFAQAILNSNRRGQAQSVLDEVQSRHHAIVKISKDMEELSQLFHDLEVMAAEQAAPVQQIEVRAEQAQTDIERGVGETSQAVKSARAARRKKWICLGIVLLICVILAVVLGAVFGSR